MLIVAVIGCGYWGPNLIRNFNALSDCKIKTICDLDNKRLSYLANLYPGIKTTTNIQDIMGDSEIDAVAIATPVFKHFKQAQKCLVAKKHAFIEKPMASSVKECRELITIADKNNLTIMVGHTFIYTSAERKIKELIKNEDIG